ncbi:MAG: DUF1272 domain-containing protein [Bryobacteraceae bacterium]
MLELKPACESCGAPLAPESTSAFICSYECTFCSACAAIPLGGRCPNCQGELMPRPARGKAPDPPAPEQAASPYHSRRVRFHGVDDFGGWKVKMYSICHQSRDKPDSEEWAAAKLLAHSTLHSQASGGAAFLIVHKGEDGEYVLVDWWSDGNILNNRLWIRNRGEANFRDVRHGTWTACVWELNVIAAEHRAWMNTAMNGDTEKYWQRWLEGLL